MSKHIKRIFIFILGFFLFSCDTVQKDDNKINVLKFMALAYQDPPIRAEYGMPSVQFVISGSVVDGDSNPIQGIQVSFCNMYAQSDISGIWTIDSGGSFCPKPYTLQVKDVDGNQNGSFDDAQILLNLVQTESENKWYEGKFEQSGISIILEPKIK